jgi:glycerophosphoryl diester phosphodiesterase
VGNGPVLRVIGHRGASAWAPENSLEAIDLAFASGAEGVEVDVRGTRDGVLVLLHDPTVDRTTNGTGALAGLSSKDLAVLDAGYRLPAWRGRGVAVPTVQGALDAVSGRGQLILEIKGHPFETGYDPAEDTPESLAKELSGRAHDEVIVSSVNYLSLERARRRLPSLRTALLVPPGFDAASAVQTAVAGGHSELHIAETLVDDRVFSEARSAGLGVVAWTVNEGARVRELEAIGLDGVITDDPKGALAALGRG